MKAEVERGTRSWVVGVGTALALLLASLVGGLALQSPADAYPGTVCTVQISPSSGHVRSGQTLTLTGKASATTKWTVTIDGVVHYYTGTTFTEYYKVPRMNHQSALGITVSCSNSSGALTLRYRIVVDPYSLSGPPSAGGSGHLPNTGGPSLWWLLAGLLFVVLGATLTLRHRAEPKPIRRHVRGG